MVFKFAYIEVIYPASAGVYLPSHPAGRLRSDLPRVCGGVPIERPIDEKF